MRIQDLSIRIKLIFLLSGLLGFVLTGILLIIGNSLIKNIKTQVITDFKKTQYYFKKQGALVYDRLVESSLLIGENAVFKANVDLKDPNSVMEAVKEFSNYTKSDLMIVTDFEGKVLAWLDRPEKVSFNIKEWEGVNNALEGIDPEPNMTWPLLWEIESQLYQVVSVPIIAGESVLGTLTLGTQFTAFEANDLKGESNVEITMILDQKIFASSFSDDFFENKNKVFKDVIDNNQNVIKNVLSQSKTSDPFEIYLGENEAYVYVSPLGIGENAVYIASVWKTDVMVLLDLLLSKIIWIGLISFIVSLFLAYFISRRTTKPIIELVAGMKMVKEGELEIKIPVSSNDEIGLLTKSFNEMIKVLKERMFMKKYIGRATFDMIQQTENENSALKGKRVEITVLFSDIRGFTQFCENTPPKEVVSMLNDYLGFQADLVEAFGGDVDKFVGDEMVAVFSGENSFTKALNCAIKIQSKAKGLNSKSKNLIGLGIGINKGEVIMGNIGSQNRMDYTVIGSTVNLGSRLCSRASIGEILFLNSFSEKKYQTKVMKFKGINGKLKVASISTH